MTHLVLGFKDFRITGECEPVYVGSDLDAAQEAIDASTKKGFVRWARIPPGVALLPMTPSVVHGAVTAAVNDEARTSKPEGSPKVEKVRK